MSMREIGRVFGLLLAIMTGGAGMVVAQERPQHRPHPTQRLCKPDTTRVRVLGRPVRPGGPMMPGRMLRHGPVMHGQMMHSGMMHSGMIFGIGGSGPAAMLLQREALGLTPEQIQRLEVLVVTQRRTMEQLRPELLRGMADLMAAVSGEMDLDAARAAHDRLARVHEELMIAHLQALRDARQTLTPEQLTRWDALGAAPAGIVRPMQRRLAPRTPAMRQHEWCR